MTDKVQNKPGPRKLPLVVEYREAPHTSQAVITTAEGPSLKNWDAEYVHLSGYAGPYGFEVFAAAPDLLEALRGAIGALEFSRDCHADLSNQEEAFAQDRLDAARAAIAKAEGRG